MEIKLKRRDLSVWSVEAQEWELELGAEYLVYVGVARDICLSWDHFVFDASIIQADWKCESEIPAN